MPRKAKRDLVVDMDTEAEELLNRVKDEKVSLDTRLAVFSQVARWVQVRNRLGDRDEAATELLNVYRSTIETGQQGALAEREAERVKDLNDPPRRFLGRKQRAAKHGTRDNGGAELEALKSRLPRANVSDPDGDRRGGGGEAIGIAGANRLIRAELPGDRDWDLDSHHSGDEF